MVLRGGVIFIAILIAKMRAEAVKTVVKLLFSVANL